MLILQDITYIHPNKDVLFEHINLSVTANKKVSLIGHNGAGKSTMLRLIAGELTPFSGQIICNTDPYYIPQHFGQFDDLCIAQILKTDDKLKALQAILAGTGTDSDFDTLADDWTIEERIIQALADWDLQDLDIFQPLSELSGGQKTRVFLAGITIHSPQFILLDEPSNHLDFEARKRLYHLISATKATLVIVSHDRELLDLVDLTVELKNKHLSLYGGNYAFYVEQKAIEQAALEQDIHSQERALKQAKIKARDAMERQQKRDTRGRAQQEKAGVARIMLKTYKDQSEQSTAKMQTAHAEKTSYISQNLSTLRAGLPAIDQLQIRLNSLKLPAGKTVFDAEKLNFSYNGCPLWPDEGLTFKIMGGERIALKGLNGSGKTTLVKLLLGKLSPISGDLKSAVLQPVYIDQDYTLIDEHLTVYEQAQSYNGLGMEEHEVRTRLHQCLFDQEDWDKPCSALSGGERLRLALCCLTLQQHAPDLLVLDEPTNNLDIAGIRILTSAVSDYAGTLMVISHDNRFIADIGITRELIVQGLAG